MDRLTTVNGNNNIELVINESRVRIKDTDTLAVAKKLKEYEDLEEQDRLLKLPCKVGNIVYCIENKEIYTCTVEKISISKNNGVWVEINFPKEMPDIVAIEYNLDDIGKTVFLAKSEAEAKLKELRGINSKTNRNEIEEIER